MTTSAELDMATVTVTPGGSASTTLTVRNDSDIVEAYNLEVVGECADWTTVVPARVSLYPGTSETVTVLLAPPRSPDVHAGEVPLGVRVLPEERPESAVVPETTVFIEAFDELRAGLMPHRRRGWFGARYVVSVRNQGNTLADVAVTATQPGEELRFGVTPGQLRIEPGADLEAKLRVRVGKLIWFGKPVTWPFDVEPALTGERVRDDTQRRSLLNGEFVQLSVFPRWLLALLGVLLALLIAWFALVRPAVQSAAQQAAEHKVQQLAAASGQRPGGGGNPGTPAGGQQAGGKQAGGQGNQGTGNAPGPGAAAGTPQQSSATINVRTNAGGHSVGAYTVPTGKLFLITDIVVANFQGDEGVMTITFGDRTITTIALETFRNQDYHWVTPIEVPANARVTADVNCTKPGTPASGRQATACTELLNVSGELRDTTG